MQKTQQTADGMGIVLGVDTHLDAHVAVALDRLGRRLGAVSVPADARGYEALVSWAEEFGPLTCAGVEGTSSYGAGLARYLGRMGIEVLEVERPKRRHLGRNGKSDPKDAEAAARAVLAGDVAGEPKSGDGRVEMIRALRAVRRSAVKARSQAAHQLRSLRVTAPDGFRDRLRGLSTKELVAAAVRFRPGALPETPEEATKIALRSVARRHRALSEEITELDAQLERLVAEAAPGMLALLGVSTDHTAALLVAAGDNPERLKGEASFASLCGVSPIEASSGKVVRHRLNRGGNRDANRALHMICVVRMRYDRRTKLYVARRTAEGKSKREIIRCLKRYVAREVYRALTAASASGASPGLTNTDEPEAQGHEGAAGSPARDVPGEGGPRGPAPLALAPLRDRTRPTSSSEVCAARLDEP